MKVDINTQNRLKTARIKMSKTCPSHETNKLWPMVRLGDVCRVVLGGTPKTGIPEYWDGDIPWLTPGDMGKIAQMYVDASNCKRKITQLGLDSGSTLCPARSVILSTRAPIGYVFVNSVPMATNQGCKTLVPSDDVYPEYLCFNLLGRTDELNELGTGTTFKELATGNLKAMTLPLPPLSEQKEIVARLERELAAVEKMKKGFEALAETAKAEFKAELKEVFEELRCSGVEMKRLGEVGRVAMCKRVLKDQTSDNGDVPFFKIGTFGKEPNAYISNELFDEFVKKFSYPKKGDVLISAAGTIGRTIVFDGKPSYFQDSNIVWLEHDGTKVTNEYLHCFYWSKPWKISDGATIPRIYNGDIESVEIPLLSLPVQRQIVARLSAAKTRTEKLEAKAREGVAVCATMRKAILKEAFE